MNSRALAYLAATVAFTALATPPRLAAQVEQQPHNNQADYFVKNLDKLDSAGIVVACMSDANSANADSRPDVQPPYNNGACAVNRSTNKLTGYCYKFQRRSMCVRNDPRNVHRGYRRSIRAMS
jgi:hypothetical protein